MIKAEIDLKHARIKIGYRPMSFVARELDRISARLHEPELPEGEYERLYAAQQALSWALDPEGFKAPYSAITGILASSEGC